MKNILQTSTLLSTLASVFICFSLNAQTSFTLNGKVTDLESGKGIPYAFVQTENDYTTAGLDGSFQLDLSDASTAIQVSQLGYEPTVVSWEKSGNQLEIKLKPAPVQLESILVSTDRQRLIPQSDIFNDKSKVSAQPVDIGDLLNEQPGFSMIKRGAYAQDPVFRSFKYEQINLIYDGGIQATHACPARMDPASTHLNPGEIQKMEVIKGPFSVRYGQTMGAIANLVTASPMENKKGWGGFAETGYESNGNGKLGHLGLEYGSQDWNFSLTGGIKDFGNYSDGNGEEIPTSFRTYDYSLKTGYKPGKNQTLQLSWRQAYARDVLHPALMMDTDEDNTSLLSLDYKLSNLSPKVFSLNIKTYGSQVDHIMSNGQRPNFGMVDAVATVQSRTAGGKVELSLLPAPKTIIYAGIDNRYLERSGNRVRIIKRNAMTGEELPEPKTFEDAIWQDASINNAGVFAEGRFFLSQRATLTAGLRGDWVMAAIASPAPDFEALYDELETRDELNFSGNISYTYQVKEQTHFQLALGRGTRTANMIERYINHFTVGQDAYEYVGNPELKPEANHQAELSFSSGEKEGRWSVSGSIFFSYLTDYITARVDTTLQRKFMPMMQPQNARRFVNIDKATSYGTEWSFEYSINRYWRARSGFSYNRAQNLDWDEPLPEIAPFEGLLSIEYKNALWWARAEGRFVDDQNRISEDFGEPRTPGFALFNIRAGIQPLEGLSIGASVLNLLDRPYYEHLNRSFRNGDLSGRLFEQGRNFTFFVSYRI
jgi:iron complex outermembrane receptor protein